MSTDLGQSHPNRAATARRVPVRALIIGLTVAVVVAVAAVVVVTSLLGALGDDRPVPNRAGSPIGPDGAGPSPASVAPRPSLPGTSVASVARRLPAAWNITLEDYADGIYGKNFTDPLTGSWAQVSVQLAAPPHTDRISDLHCSFNGIGEHVTVAVLNEVKACVDTVLPDAQKTSVAAWLDSNTATMSTGDRRPGNFAPYYLLILQTKDQFSASVYAQSVS